MAAPRRRLIFGSKALILSSSGLEKPRSLAGRGITEWCLGYQRTIEAARRDYLLLTEQEEPLEVENRQGEVEMRKAGPDLVRKQLLEPAQQVVHVKQVCNKEKDILEDELD
jgi:hypothetical protein